MERNKKIGQLFLNVQHTHIGVTEKEDRERGKHAIQAEKGLPEKWNVISMSDTTACVR